jgi:hypothetical protein
MEKEKSKANGERRMWDDPSVEDDRPPATLGGDSDMFDLISFLRRRKVSWDEIATCFYWTGPNEGKPVTAADAKKWYAAEKKARSRKDPKSC